MMIVSVPLRTLLTTLIKLSFISLDASNSYPVSSVAWTSKRPVKSPTATVGAMVTKGRVIERRCGSNRHFLNQADFPHVHFDDMLQDIV